jgi:hypothetical protein
MGECHGESNRAPPRLAGIDCLGRGPTCESPLFQVLVATSACPRGCNCTREDGTLVAAVPKHLRLQIKWHRVLDNQVRDNRELRHWRRH